MSEVLKKFMLENFDFKAMKRAGFYGKEVVEKDYELQSQRICHFFSLDSIFEYCQDEIMVHLSYESKRPKDEPFVTVIKQKSMIPKELPKPNKPA